MRLASFYSEFISNKPTIMYFTERPNLEILLRLKKAQFYFCNNLNTMDSLENVDNCG